MAKSKDTFNKKEKEKKRIKQKLEKKQKMEERKSHKKKGNSLEDMLAYVDENGNLSDTPPDPRNKKIFKQENIQIGTPKQDHTHEEHRNGMITFYNKPKGFGFITDLLSNEKIFFHVNNILEPLEESDKVKFKVERGPRGLSAVQVAKLV
jgi:cold shock CspA family protein